MPDARKRRVALISTEGKTKDQVKAEARAALLKFEQQRLGNPPVADEASEAMGALELLRAYGNGEISYDTLLADFRALPMAVQKPAQSARESYARAEEVNPADVPGAIDTAAYAGIIDDRQEEELLGIYRSKISE